MIIIIRTIITPHDQIYYHLNLLRFMKITNIIVDFSSILSLFSNHNFYGTQQKLRCRTIIIIIMIFLMRAVPTRSSSVMTWTRER